MKAKLNKKLRIGLICISLVFIVSISFLLYTQVQNPQFKAEQISLYSYESKSDINYEVFLKPNILFDQESLEEDFIYFTEFVDYITASFYYQFQGEEPGDIKGDYEIVAVMEGYDKQGEEERTLWERDFVILPSKSFETKDRVLTVKESISFQLPEYNEFAERVAEATKIRALTRLTVKMNVNVKVHTDQGIIEEEISPAMMLPLQQSQFRIVKQQVMEREDHIEETISIEIPIDRKSIVLHGVPIGIFIIVLIYLIFFTSAKSPKGKLEKTLNNIFKKHGSRFVALDEEKADIHQDYYKVRTIDDLVKIADEIQKPIFYKYRSNTKNITEFYIVDDTSIYIFDLKPLVEKPKSAETGGELHTPQKSK